MILEWDVDRAEQYIKQLKELKENDIQIDHEKTIDCIRFLLVEVDRLEDRIEELEDEYEQEVAKQEEEMECLLKEVSEQDNINTKLTLEIEILKKSIEKRKCKCKS